MNNIIRIIMIFCALTIHFALSGCGSGGSGGVQNSGVTFPPASSSNSVVDTGNSYTLTSGFEFPIATFMMAINNGGVFALRAAVAEKMTVDNPADIFRINILSPSQISKNGSYSVGENNPQAPVEIIFPDCQKSFLLHTVSGSITFQFYGANTGDLVAGTFDVKIEDGSSGQPYNVSGSFSFIVGSSGPV